MRNYIIRSKMYSSESREAENLDEIRKYVKNWYPAKVKEVYVFSKNGKQYGNVLFSDKGKAYWYNTKGLFFIKEDGSLGKRIDVSRYAPKYEPHPFGL